MPPPEGTYRGLLLDIGGVVHRTSMSLAGRLAETEPRLRPVLDRVGGLGTDRDELWQRMLDRQLSEREYWAQRAAEFGAAVGESWDTRALINKLYDRPERDYLCWPTIDLMNDVKTAGLRLGAARSSAAWLRMVV